MLWWVSPLVNSQSQLWVGLTRGGGLHQLHATKETITPMKYGDAHSAPVKEWAYHRATSISRVLILPFQHSRTHARGTIWRRAIKFWLSHLCRFLFHMGPVQSKICMKVKLRSCTILVHSKYLWLWSEWRTVADNDNVNVRRLRGWERIRGHRTVHII